MTSLTMLLFVGLCFFSGGAVGALGAWIFCARELARREQVRVTFAAQAEARTSHLIERLDAVRSEHVRQIIALRRDGFQAGSRAKVIEPPDPEGEGLARAEAGLSARRDDVVFIQNATEELMRKGYNQVHAIREAKRLREELRMEDPPG